VDAEAWTGGSEELMRRRRAGRVMEWRDTRWRSEVEVEAEMEKGGERRRDRGGR
jgi:hypothetical protein